MNYHIGLASVYLLVAFVSLCQLTIAVAMSCRQCSKGNWMREALSPTTPKVIYAIIFLAASIRAAYFAVSVKSLKSSNLNHEKIYLHAKFLIKIFNRDDLYFCFFL